MLRPELQLNLLEFFCLQWESNAGRYFKDDFLNNLLYINWNLRSEEIAYTYLSLLKRISLGLDQDKVRLLFNPDTTDFPIFSTALKFWKHSDQLNRVSCHTILLNIFKFSDEEIIDDLLNKKNATSNFVNSFVKDIKW
jgi:hypothetical protein